VAAPLGAAMRRVVALTALWQCPVVPPIDQEIKLDRKEVQKLESFFQRRFNSKGISIRPRPRKDDSAEVYFGDEFVGVLFRDDEEGELSYNFTMAILDIDLEEA
jgi:hypothetical protein